MNDLFESMINAARTPERAGSLLALVELLYSANYSDELERINEIAAVNDSVSECIDEIEGLIFVCTKSLCDRLGLGIDYTTIREQPHRIQQILTVICEQLEDFEDYDSLLAILESDEPNEIMVGNLVSFITAEQEIVFHDIIQYVQPKLIRTIKSVLNAKVIVGLESLDTIDPKRVQRVIAFIHHHPLTPLSELFDNYGFLKPTAELAKHIHLEPVDILGHGFVNELATVVAGLVLALDINAPNRLYLQIEEIAPLVIPDDYMEHTLDVNRIARGIVEEILNETA